MGNRKCTETDGATQGSKAGWDAAFILPELLGIGKR